MTGVRAGLKCILGINPETPGTMRYPKKSWSLLIPPPCLPRSVRLPTSQNGSGGERARQWAWRIDWNKNFSGKSFQNLIFHYFGDPTGLQKVDNRVSRAFSCVLGIEFMSQLVASRAFSCVLGIEILSQLVVSRRE